VSSGFPRWWRLGLASTEVVLAAGFDRGRRDGGRLVLGGGRHRGSDLALINLSVYLLTERERRRPPDP
jgi:hypothetical protein